MSTIQQINASKEQFVTANQNSSSDAANSVLLLLQETIDSYKSTQDDEALTGAQASVEEGLNQIGQNMKALFETNHSLPSESLFVVFYFLGQLNGLETTNADLQAFLGQANNAFGVAESSDAQKNFVKAAKDYYKSTHQPWWDKILKIVVPVILVLVSVVSMDPGMLIAAVATAALTGPAGKAMSKGITEGLEKFLPKDVAEFVGGLLTVAAITVGSLGVGAAASLESVGSELGELGSDLSKLKDTLSKVTVNVPRMSSVAMMGGFSALAKEGPQIVAGFVDALPVSDEVKKALTITFDAILEVVAIAGAMVGGYGALKSNDTDVNLLSNGLKKAADKAGGFITEKLPKVVDALTPAVNRIVSVSEYIKNFALISAGTAECAVAGYDGVQASAMTKLGTIDASLKTLSSSEKATQVQTSNIVQDAIQMMQEFGVMINRVGNLLNQNQNIVADMLAQ